MAALEKGREVESEHTDDPAVAAVIAAHHINEFPTYYEALDKMESELKDEESEEKSETDEDPDLDDYEEVPFGANDEEESEEDEEAETDEPKGDEEGDD